MLYDDKYSLTSLLPHITQHSDPRLTAFSILGCSALAAHLASEARTNPERKAHLLRAFDLISQRAGGGDKDGVLRSIAESCLMAGCADHLLPGNLPSAIMQNDAAHEALTATTTELLRALGIRSFSECKKTTHFLFSILAAVVRESEIKIALNAFESYLSLADNAADVNPLREVLGERCGFRRRTMILYAISRKVKRIHAGSGAEVTLRALLYSVVSDMGVKLVCLQLTADAVDLERAVKDAGLLPA